MRDGLYKIFNKFQIFMYGRNGVDQLFKFSLWIYIILLIAVSIAGRFVSNTAYSVISAVPFVFMLFTLYRPFSKNIPKRRAENEKYLKFTGKLKAQFKYVYDKWKFRKTYVLKKCPNCRAVLKLKKRKGRHTALCPCCNTKIQIKAYHDAVE